MNIRVVGQLIGGFCSIACGCDIGLASEVLYLRSIK
jgi:hypothetical protein